MYPHGIYLIHDVTSFFFGLFLFLSWTIPSCVTLGLFRLLSWIYPLGIYTHTSIYTDRFFCKKDRLILHHFSLLSLCSSPSLSSCVSLDSNKGNSTFNLVFLFSHQPQDVTDIISVIFIWPFLATK